MLLKRIIPIFVLPCISIAGTMGTTCTKENVTLPCASTAWSFSGEALYLKPAYNQSFGFLADTAIASTGSGSQSIEVARSNDLQANWGWGYKLQAQYYLSTGNDLSINWYHFNNSGTHTYTPGDTPTELGSRTYTLSPTWNAVNLEFGQAVDFNQFKNMRLYFGVQFDEIKTNLYDAGISSNANVGYEYNYMKYRGAGPRAGLNLAYDIYKGLAIYGDAAAAILGGENDLNYGETFGAQNFVTGSKFSIVPELEVKAGLKYDYAFDLNHVTFDIGYMFVDYFNSLVVNDDGDESNFALNGLYFGLKWRGN